jgi:pimeloyl-ACP methyl ester carboxylesterase
MINQVVGAMKKTTLTLLFAFSFLMSIAQNNPLKIYRELQYCRMEGIPDSVLCGKFPVYENRETQKGRVIDLNIVVVPAIHRDSAGTPIFYFEGGPGVAATHSASFFAEPANPYRQYHDIVLVDVRGTGGSNPLHCSSLQTKRGLKEHFEEMYPEEAVKECFDSLSKRADLKQYTTTNVVNDIEDIRKWLGYGKVNIFGLSYGTRVALVYMKMFPSAIGSCVLWSPTHTYSRMPLYHARFAQNSLEQVFEDCKQDPLCNNSFPAIKDEFNTLMKKRRNEPFKFLYADSAGDSRQLSISWNAFQTKLRTLMYDPAGIRQIPYIIHEVYRGNLEPFIALYPITSQMSSFIAEGFYLCITCTEDVPFIKTNQIESLTKGTFMGSYRVDQQKKACSNWVRGKTPADYFDPVKSDIPTLIISGGFDPVTPVSMAKEIARHLSRSTLVIIPQMSHMFDGLSHPECFDDICLSFINAPGNPKLNLACIKEMKPENYRVKE